MLSAKNDVKRKPIKCALCIHFFVTHRPSTPWGCRKFGFRSKIIPSALVFSSTGTDCAFFNDRTRAGFKKV